MTSRRQFLQQGSFGFLPLLLPVSSFSKDASGFEGIVVNEEEGEAFRLRDGSPVVRIKISKQQGSHALSFLASSLPPGDVIPVHKHLNEDEFFFIHKGSGLFTLGEKQYAVKEGAIIISPRNVWHGLQNSGTETIEMRFGYTPAGFEGFFKEVGTPVGQPFVAKTMDERRAIAKKWGMIFKD
jgi:quercetin dioxygenase-like cupin family protein